MKNFKDEELPHELFVTTRQSVKTLIPLLIIGQQI